jgi:hypothetical protein
MSLPDASTLFHAFVARARSEQAARGLFQTLITDLVSVEHPDANEVAGPGGRWEVAYEESDRAPGLLIVDSPQKNLGHAARADDLDFADTRLVENFYQHAKDWLAGPGNGAQLIVIDNSPPQAVARDVVIRYTRDKTRPPYGLISDAVD